MQQRLRKSEEALREREEKLRSLTNIAQDAILMMDNNGNISFWNPAAEKIFGYGRDEALGKELHAFLGPGRYYEAYRKGFENFRETGQGGAVGKTLELEAVRKGGEEFVMELSLSALQIGRTWHAVGIIRDISARKLMEEVLREAEHKYHHLFDNLTDAAFVADAESGIILDTNLKGEQLLGRAREEIIGMSQSELHPPGESEEYRRRFRAHISQGHLADYDGEVIRSDGTTVPVSISAASSVLAGRSIVLGLFRDITERKRMEAEIVQRALTADRHNDALVALARGEEIYSADLGRAFNTITESSAYAIGVGRVSIWFYTSGDAAINCMDLYEMRSGKHSGGVTLRASDFPAYFRALQQEYCIAADDALADPRTSEFAESYLEPLGITSMLDIPITVAGKVIGVVCHEHVGDPRKWTVEEQSFVTAIAGFTSAAIEAHERHRAEENIKKLNEELELKVDERTRQLVNAQEELVRKEKLSILGQLAGSVGHELRNPLGVINNAVYFLKTIMPDADETIREYLDMIKSEVDNSQRIISDLLDFSRTKPPQTVVISPAELIGQSLSKCVIPDNVKLDIDIPDDMSLIRPDPLQMSQVFQNLIVNACQAMAEGGTLHVSARTVQRARRKVQGSEDSHIDRGIMSDAPDEDFVEIRVSDSGTGISLGDMNRLFQPLFTTKARGIGLGLTVCKRLTNANGGEIIVESQQGKGTTFTVVLPAGSKR